MKKIGVLVVLLTFFALLPQAAFAKGPFNKFGRGVTDIVMSPAEYVVQIADLGQDNDPLTAFFGGLLKGTAYMVARIGTGVYEVVTFPVPLPRDYAPVWKTDTVVNSLKTYA